MSDLMSGTQALAHTETGSASQTNNSQTTATTTNNPPSLLSDSNPASQQGDVERRSTDAHQPQGVTYADFQLPAGAEVDAPALDQAKKLFAADGLSQDRAQAYVDLYTAKLQEANEAPYKLWAETQRQWQDSVRNDREIGGAKLGANLSIAAKAIDRFGGDALRQALNVSGAGNHPDVIRAFIRIGKAISEDNLVMGRGSPQDSRNRADRLYPTDPLNPR